jgi:periplasmic divalent cation tolerance protein
MSKAPQFSDKRGHPVKTWVWYPLAMADALELHVTMPDKDRAASLARALVDEGLAACVNIVPGVRSIYQWDGRVQEDDEVLCLIKTRPAVFDRARDRILQLHPYEVPEILAFAVDDGSPAYLEWLKKSTP